MDDLLKDAIADAKAVRETALANAKIALEEAFTPRLQSMLSKKITAEMEDAEETEDAEERGMDEEEAEEMEDKDEEDKMDEEMSDKEEEDKVDENDVSSEIGKADNKVADAANDSSKVGAPR